MPKAPLTLLVCLLFALAGCAGSSKVAAVGTKSDAPEVAKKERPPLPACLTDVMGMGPDLDVSTKQAETGVACLRFNVELADAPSRGPADAPITLVMFSDFECPYCQRGYELVKEIAAAVRAELSGSVPEAAIARAVGDIVAARDGGPAKPAKSPKEAPPRAGQPRAAASSSEGGTKYFGWKSSTSSSWGTGRDPWKS